MELIKIGKALKTHGYKGHLRIAIDAFYMDDFEEMKIIFIENLPYFIVSKDINTDSQAIISLEDITTKEMAFLLQGKPIFAKEEDLTEILEDDPYQEIVGFMMIDKTHGELGKIEKIIEFPQQYLAQIFQDKKEILIPLNNTFIQKIDIKSKTVSIHLPDGFLEVF
ncbi:MAG: 16S rRNA processing protein RimM [Saprospirales bacterium]|nr:16S rRNA processing protein RimM [Saprospirales bacterium]